MNVASGTRACALCARRSPLLAELGVSLDFRARDLSRFWELLVLDDEQLIEALGGRRRTELRRRHSATERQTPPLEPPFESVCRHRQAYPVRLHEQALAPRALYTRGPAHDSMRMLEGSVVAIVGTPQATDYGMETARGLARELAGCGIGVVAVFAEGIAQAAHVGALEAQGSTLTLMGGGVERCSPACCAGLYRQLSLCGGVISELAPGVRPRIWSRLARVRTLALLADLVIVVEARENPRELACARLARALGRTLAAVPGRVSSPASEGANMLIREGAALVREAQDALDLLYGVGAQKVAALQPPGEPRLQAILEKVAEGRDTLAKLAAAGSCEEELTLALTELELRGLLVRGDGGRYVAQRITGATAPPGTPDRVPPMPRTNPR